MSHLNPDKLHVKLDGTLGAQENLLPRKYTLTHSDTTGDLFLTIGCEYDQDAISGWYTRLMRDEVLGEWLQEVGLALHIHLHVSGGLAFGPAPWRESIFKQHLPLVLEAICYGDRPFIVSHPAFQQAPIKVHFHAKQAELDKVDDYQTVRDFLRVDQ
jgi:hypothetical protein